MWSVQRGSNTSARLNFIFSRKTDPQILQPPLYASLHFPIPVLLGIRHGRQGPFYGDSIFLFFAASSMSSLVLFPQTRATRRAFNATRRKSARNYLRFIANIGFVAPLDGAAGGGAWFLSSPLPSIPFVPPINENSIQST